MRHIGSLCKLTDYLKTVEFLTLKTSQCNKGNNADSKKVYLKCQVFAQVSNFSHSKVKYEFSGRHNWANLLLGLNDIFQF